MSGQELSSKYWTPELGGPAEKVTEDREPLVEDLGKEEEMFGGQRATALMGDSNGKVTRCLSGEVRRRGYV